MVTDDDTSTAEQKPSTGQCVKAAVMAYSYDTKFPSAHGGYLALCERLCRWGFAPAIRTFEQKAMDNWILSSQEADLLVSSDGRLTVAGDSGKAVFRWVEYRAPNPAFKSGYYLIFRDSDGLHILDSMRS